MAKDKPEVKSEVEDLDPKEGGSYIRNADGSLKKQPPVVKPTPEIAAEATDAKEE